MASWFPSPFQVFAFPLPFRSLPFAGMVDWLFLSQLLQYLTTTAVPILPPITYGTVFKGMTEPGIKVTAKKQQVVKKG